VVHPFVQKPAEGTFICRPFEPSIRMEYAMFRQPRGEISNAAELMAQYIMAETRRLGIPVSHNRIKSRRAA
jgi:hypothetical protein